MLTPFEVKDNAGRKTLATVTDEGISATMPEGLARLRPAQPGGTATLQTATVAWFSPQRPGPES